MIKLRRHKRIYTEIGLVSATDVMSLLLIFCMLMVSSGALTTLNVSLPTSKSVENSSKEIVVTITSSLEYYIDGQKVHKDEVSNVLSQKINYDGCIVLLNIDKIVPVEYLVFIADIVTSKKAKVVIATKQNELIAH